MHGSSAPSLSFVLRNGEKATQVEANIAGMTDQKVTSSRITNEASPRDVSSGVTAALEGAEQVILGTDQQTIRFT